MDSQVYPFILVTMEDGCIIGLANSLGECLFAMPLPPAVAIDLTRYGSASGEDLTETKE